MTQGAGQGPVVRTATLRDFRVPPYAQVPVQGHSEHPQPQQPQQPAPPQPQRAPEASEQRVPPQPHQPSAPQAPAAQPQAPQAPGHQPEQSPATPPHAQAQPPAPQPPAAQQPPAPQPQSVIPPFPAPQLPHPGNAFPDDDYPEGYTPTERDLPVINRGDTLQVSVTPPPAPAQAPAPVVGQGPGPGPLYVVGDVHGYLDELLAALREQGLIDGDGHWSAGNTRLWFLGDFTDRGPDGIGVIDLVMRLSAEAAAAGGYCKALMGNHELLLLGAKRFGDTPVNSGAGTATFQAAWLLNGGQKSDMDRLQDVHLQWMSRLDAIVEQDGHLLLHSDTTAYLEYGDTIEDVNDTIHEILTRNDADECWDLFRKFTKRFAFRDEGGANAVRELLAAYGGERVVHGHSPIPYLLGEVGTEDADGESTGPVVEGPHVYADGLAIAMDGGVTMAGKLLVQQLPLPH
ncbi:metallophosphoesterase [Streptomyces sp. enrichment culture]|uniref:metallophosphoesterase n=1 Tax=Streptomyces sp. enrichment culture TaxID=1795815 RepID=UPI003F55A710